MSLRILWPLLGALMFLSPGAALAREPAAGEPGAGEPGLDADTKRLVARFTKRDARYPSQLLGKDVPLREGRYRRGISRSQPGYTNVQLSEPRVADLDLDGRPELVVVVRELHCPSGAGTCIQATRVEVWGGKGRRIKRLASHDDGPSSGLDGVKVAEGVLVLERTLCCFDDRGLSQDVTEVWRLTRDGLKRALTLPSRPYYPYSQAPPTASADDVTF